MMNLNRLTFSINIKAKQSKIWEALWDKNAYKNWASVFFEGSYIIADNWSVGKKVLFLGPDQSGIYSIIEEHIPNKTILFRHTGSVVNGEEQPIDDETKKWSGANERYTIIKGAEYNKLTIEIDVLDEHLEFMKDKLPKGLEKIKENCG